MNPLKRTCSKCGIEKNIDQFHRSGMRNGEQLYRSNCKPCANQYHLDRKDKRRKMLYEIKKDLCCCMCGYSKETHKSFRTGALEFHHHEDNKSFSVSDAFSNGYEWSRIINEIEKCIVVCARCHAEIHAINDPD